MQSFLDFISGDRRFKATAAMRIDEGVYSRCAADNILNEKPDCELSRSDILYSARSLSRSKELHDEFRYLSEADLKTYPTDKFSRVFMKTVAEICGFKYIAAGPTLTDEYLVYDNGKTIIAGEFDKTSRSGAECFISIHYNYIEHDIAGKITYRLFTGGNSRTDIEKKLKTGLGGIIKAGDYCGYNYVTHCLFDYSTGQFIPEFAFESKFQTSQFKLSDKLYHIAPASLKEKILKYGISPKSKSANGGTAFCHPDRVYLFNLYDENLFRLFCRQSKKKSFGYSKEMRLRYFNYEYAVFEIDPAEIPGLVLFRDNNFQSGDASSPTAVYSYTNIPPAAISFLKEIKLS